MAYLTATDVALAIGMVVWARSLTRARDGEIPCTERLFSPLVVLWGVLSLVAVVVTNVLVLSALDRAFGRHLSPGLFTAWVLSMSGAAIALIVALTSRDTNRKAAAWVRLIAPDTIVFRAGDQRTTVTLEPGAVRVAGLVGGVGGVPYVQYLVRSGDRAIALLVVYTRDAAAAIEGAVPLAGPSGLFAQGDARALHRHLGRYLERG